jgi:hypothetical protein
LASIREENNTIFNFADEREQLIDKLKGQISLERVLWLGLVILMTGGYVFEYLVLKRKFLLFK